MAGWMKTPLGTEVDLGPGHIVLDGVPAPAKRAQQPPLFSPCLLWPRSPISATAELFSIFHLLFVSCKPSAFVICALKNYLLICLSPHRYNLTAPSVLFAYRYCSVLFLQTLAVLDPRIDHTMDVLSPYISILCHSY